MLVARLLERNLKTRYVREYFIPFRMMPDRMAEVRDQLQPLATTQVNRDFSPIAYYFNVVLWSAQFKPDYAGLAAGRGACRVSRSFSALFLSFLLSIAALLGVCARARAARPRRGCLLDGRDGIYADGAANLFAARIPIHLRLCLPSTRHSDCSVHGRHCFGKLAGHAPHPPRQLIPLAAPLRSLSLLLALSAPVLMLLVSLLAKTSGTVATWLAAQCVFPALAALCGNFGRLPVSHGDGDVSSRTKASGRSLGTLYAVDLLGGCAGALVLSGYLIPVFGFWKTAWLCAAVNLAPALLAARVSLQRDMRRSCRPDPIE